MTTQTVTPDPTGRKGNGGDMQAQIPEENNQAQSPQDAQAGATPRVVRSPDEVLQLILMQLDAVNGKKDELTIAIKGLTDLTKQLTRAYGEHLRVIKELHERVRVLEGESGAEQ